MSGMIAPENKQKITREGIYFALRLGVRAREEGLTYVNSKVQPSLMMPWTSGSDDFHMNCLTV